MKQWVEKSFDGDPVEAVKRVMSSKSSGQLVLNVSQGAVCNVTWRERKNPETPIPEKVLDNAPAT